MSVSFEINDVREAPAAVATPVIVERPKSAMQARRSPLISIFAYVDEGDVSVLGFQLKKHSCPLQISVDNAKVVHVLQAVCNVN